MDNLPDKDIDFIFKEGSENYDFPFKESAWGNMDDLLDIELKKHRRKRWIFLLCFLIATTIGVGIMTYWNLTSTTATSNTAVEQTSVPLEKETVNVIDDTNKDQKNTNTNDITTSNKENLQTPNRTTAKERIIKEQPFSNDSKQQLVKPKKKNIPPVRNDKIAIDYTPTSSEITKIALPKNQSTESTAITPTSNRSLMSDKLTDTETPRTTFNVEPIFPISLQAITFDDKTDEIDVPTLKYKKPNNNTFKIGLVAGQEWSSVGLMSNTRKGYKLGLEFAYLFKNRFQVSTGFTISKKKYQTNGINYNARQDRWTDVTPQSVDGSCDLLEIPLDFTYYFKGYEASSFYITAGLNSYIMRKEWYDYAYEPGTPMDDLPTYWSGEMKNNHILSVTNFSVGYQQRLNDNMMIQLAPYVQIPLTGIGDGQVKLFTTGIQMKLYLGK